MGSELEEKGDHAGGRKHEWGSDKTCGSGPDDVGHSC